MHRLYSYGRFRTASGHARHADPRHTAAWVVTRLWHRPPNPAAVGGCAEGGRGVTVPALQRLLLNGWVTAEWKLSETKRRARFYRLTAAGRKQLGIEVSAYERMVAAIARVLRPA